jgi:hypothetical protein
MKKMLFSLCSLLLLDLAALRAQEVIHEHSHGPFGLRRWLLPSSNRHNISYWVGGGAASWRRGDLPTEDEGTWGLDYRGWIIQRRVNHLWFHGRRYQGGSGAYKTDGPHLPHLPHHNGHNDH